MARIVIDARELYTTSGRYTERLLHYLQHVDTAHEYCVLVKPKDFERWQPSNSRFTKVLCPHKEFTFAEQLGLLKQIKQLQPDLVFFPFVQQPILYRGKVVTTIQDLTTIRFRNPAKNWLAFTIKREVYKLVNWVAAHKSVLLIAPTAFVRDDAARYLHVSPAKFTVTHESADKITDAAEPMPGLAGKQYIMYVGRPQPHKNLDRLVQAYAEAKQTHPDLQLVLVGRSDKLFEQLQTRVKQWGVPDVVFTGFVTEGQLRWLYEHAQAYVFPSLSEGFGLPPLEAMHYNLPVVASKATCIPEVCQDAAMYFDPYSTDDMAQKISQVLDEPELAKQLAAKGSKLVKTYSWERMARQTLEVFNKALGS